MLKGSNSIVTKRRRLVHEEIVAARRDLDRVQARIRAEGEASVVAGIWDAVVDEIARLPEVQNLIAAAQQPARRPRQAPPRSNGPAPDDEEEALHQAVVALVRHAQQISTP
jgi:hypothetical protein